MASGVEVVAKMRTTKMTPNPKLYALDLSLSLMGVFKMSLKTSQKTVQETLRLEPKRTVSWFILCGNVSDIDTVTCSEFTMKGGESNTLFLR